MHTQRKSFQESAGLPILQANGIPHVLQPPMALEAADRTDWLLRTCVQCLGANNYARATDCAESLRGGQTLEIPIAQCYLSGPPMHASGTPAHPR